MYCLLALIAHEQIINFRQRLLIDTFTMTCSQGVVSADSEKAAPAGNVRITLIFFLLLHASR